MVQAVGTTQTLTPAVNVVINGRPLESHSMAAKTNLVSVTVTEDIDAASMFTLQLVNRDLDSGQPTWVDEALFDIGNSVEIGLGYGNNTTSIISGEITGLEPEFSLEAVSILTVRGHDLRHRLMRGRKTRSFKQMTDSAIATQIAQDAGIVAQVTPTDVILDYVLQHNQTDWAFLQERALRLGYEVFVDDRTLLFQPHQHTQQAVLTLTHKEDQFEFMPRLSTLAQVGKVDVRGWDPQKKETIQGRFITNEQPPEMGGITHGPQATVREFGQSSNGIVDRPLSTGQKLEL